VDTNRYELLLTTESASGKRSQIRRVTPLQLRREDSQPRPPRCLRHLLRAGPVLVGLFGPLTVTQCQQGHAVIRDDELTI
jgi:hypothetical protein